MAVLPHLSLFSSFSSPCFYLEDGLYPVAGKGLSYPCLGLIYILFRESSQGYGHVFASTVASHVLPHLGLAAEGFPTHLVRHLRVKGMQKSHLHNLRHFLPYVHAWGTDPHMHTHTELKY